MSRYLGHSFDLDIYRVNRLSEAGVNSIRDLHKVLQAMNLVVRFEIRLDADPPAPKKEAEP